MTGCKWLKATTNTNNGDITNKQAHKYLHVRTKLYSHIHKHVHINTDILLYT